MPNPDFNDDFNQRRSSAKPPATSTPGPQGSVNEKNVNWPGVPGQTQSKSRSGGVKKARIYPTSEGL